MSSQETEEALSEQPERWRLALFVPAGVARWQISGNQLISDHQWGSVPTEDRLPVMAFTS